MATRIAKDVVSGANYNPKVADALNYHANYVYPFWAPPLRGSTASAPHLLRDARRTELTPFRRAVDAIAGPSREPGVANPPYPKE